MIEEFNSLTNEELIKFEDFVRSPYFNKSNTLKKVFMYVKSKHPGLRNEDFSDKDFSMKLFSKAKITAERIRKLKFNLSLLQENFLKQSELELDVQQGNFAVLSAYKKRKNIPKYRKFIQKIEVAQEKRLNRDTNYYLNQIDLLGEKFELSILDKEFSTGYIIEEIQNVHFFFLLMSLNNIVSFLIKYPLDKEDLLENKFLYNQVLLYIKRNKEEIFEHHPMIAMYYYVALMLYENNDVHYRKLTQYFSSKNELFDFDMKVMYYLFIESYFHQKIADNIGNEYESRKQLFEIHKAAYGDNAYYERYFETGRTLTGYSFMFAVKNALSQNEAAWAENFVNKFGTHLPKNEIKDISNLSYALIKLSQKEYDAALGHLTGVNPKNLMNYTEAKIIKMMVWVETNEKKSFESELASFKKTFVKNKLIGNDVKNRLDTLLKYINSIFSMKNEKERFIKDDVKKSKLKLETEVNLFDYKFWIKHKLNELEN